MSNIPPTFDELFDRLDKRIDRLEDKLEPKDVQPDGGTLYDRELAEAGLTLEERATVKHCNTLLGEILGKAGIYEMRPGSRPPEISAETLSLFTPHVYTDAEMRGVTFVKHHIEALARVIETTMAASRYRSLALTKLEECSMWVNKGIAKKGLRSENE